MSQTFLLLTKSTLEKGLFLKEHVSRNGAFGIFEHLNIKDMLVGHLQQVAL